MTTVVLRLCLFSEQTRCFLGGDASDLVGWVWLLPDCGGLSRHFGESSLAVLSTEATGAEETVT